MAHHFHITNRGASFLHLNFFWEGFFKIIWWVRSCGFVIDFEKKSDATKSLIDLSGTFGRFNLSSALHS